MRGSKFTLFSTNLHLFALYQDFDLAQQRNDYFFNEIKDLERFLGKILRFFPLKMKDLARGVKVTSEQKNIFCVLSNLCLPTPHMSTPSVNCVHESSCEQPSQTRCSEQHPAERRECCIAFYSKTKRANPTLDVTALEAQSELQQVLNNARSKKIESAAPIANALRAVHGWQLALRVGLYPRD